MSRSFNACDIIKVSMLLNLLSANIRILSCFFFFFLVIFGNFLMIPVDRQKMKVKLALAIPTGAPIAVVNKITDIPPVFALKIIKILSI